MAYQSHVLAIFYIWNQLFWSPTSRPFLIHYFTEQFNQVNILPFVKTTNIVMYRGLLPHENQINRNRDLLQKPITSVFAVSIDW
jgi:hypothetical protein